ncbi:MAG: class I SAM-dependent methyltransferase [Verrucomicrobiia bacterium]|jgi:SAM-dependent methyltransferase
MTDETGFLDPRCSPSTLDRYSVRRAILGALCDQLPNFHGTVLDVGCGKMPYKSLVLAPPSHAINYIGLDLKGNIYQKPDVEWDGRKIPLADASIDCAMATEVFEHCPEPKEVMREILRVLKPNGLLFFTVPFLWPLHDVPHDEYRYTPFALQRLLSSAGFEKITLRALGGWDTSLAQMIGLWVRRRPFSPTKRKLLSAVAAPVVRFLIRHDQLPNKFHESCMITGISGKAVKAGG